MEWAGWKPVFKARHFQRAWVDPTGADQPVAYSFGQIHPWVLRLCTASPGRDAQTTEGWCPAHCTLEDQHQDWGDHGGQPGMGLAPGCHPQLQLLYRLAEAGLRPLPWLPQWKSVEGSHRIGQVGWPEHHERWAIGHLGRSQEVTQFKEVWLCRKAHWVHGGPWSLASWTCVAQEGRGRHPAYWKIPEQRNKGANEGPPGTVVTSWPDAFGSATFEGQGNWWWVVQNLQDGSWARHDESGGWWPRPAGQIGSPNHQRGWRCEERKNDQRRVGSVPTVHQYSGPHQFSYKSYFGSTGHLAVHWDHGGLDASRRWNPFAWQWRPAECL